MHACMHASGVCEQELVDGGTLGMHPGAYAYSTYGAGAACVHMRVCMPAGNCGEDPTPHVQSARAHACLRASMDISMRRRLSERRVYACTCVRRTGCRNRAARPRGGVQTREPACLTRSACTHGQACLSETTCPRRWSKADMELCTHEPACTHRPARTRVIA